MFSTLLTRFELLHMPARSAKPVKFSSESSKSVVLAKCPAAVLQKTNDCGWLHIWRFHQQQALVCFGDNTCGQCDVPTDLGAVGAVSAGKYHTCAVRSDGHLVCFGSNSDGQCDVPTDLGAVVAVSSGGYHTCAVRSDGRLVCFGYNAFGQCMVPTDLGAVVAVSAGDDHTCAMRSDGQLICFGSNAHGQCDVPTDLGAVVGVPLGYQQALTRITCVKSGHLPTGDAVIEPRGRSL